MPLPLPPTLVDLRRSVMVRTNLASSGNVGKAMLAYVDEAINEAQADLHMRHPYTRLTRELEVVLANGQTTVDIPADTWLGGLQRLELVNPDNRRLPMTYNDTGWPWNQTFENSAPQVWKVLNETIYIGPPADADHWPKIVMTVQLAARKLENETARCSVDGEALVKLAVIRFKEFTGTGGDTAQARQDLSGYLNDLRSNVSPGRAYAAASARPDGPAYWTAPSTDPSVTPFSPGWNPPGNW